ncbi:MAG: hypothetical protein G8345_15735, partial [Magnetococcales bacterium]|nr:hypothetical protein [Magnetococcales bacterium]
MNADTTLWAIFLGILLFMTYHRAPLWLFTGVMGLAMVLDNPSPAAWWIFAGVALL